MYKNHKDKSDRTKYSSHKKHNYLFTCLVHCTVCSKVNPVVMWVTDVEQFQMNGIVVHI